MSELPKTFDPHSIEERWYAHWESRGLFRPDRPNEQPWTIVMPPPNVTGSLHIGHALDITLQDVLTRRERMLGKDALWVVGTDHAGIATQMVVERQLDLEQKKRTDLGRDAFVERVWQWKEESGGQITQQLRRLGASCDWSHERFTMDAGFSKAVTHVFVELWKRKLLYRDKRLVNWDPRFQTAISDLEVETRDVQGKFWTLSYPLADNSGAIQVATTRPETMLADMAVAVHPEDARYSALIGKQIKHPITGRLIPIVADEHADPELGSGAVKITPGHDFNDFDVGRRAGFKAADMLNMFDGQARVVQTADGLIPDDFFVDEERDEPIVIGVSSATPESFERTERTEIHRVKVRRGIDRFEARKKVVELLEAEGALIGVEDRVIPTPFGDRSGAVIEPWLTDQWYVDAAKLAMPAVQAVKKGDIKIVPETWAKTWFNWLENIQPWCVSRQLWWGHRIPAWYGPLADEKGVRTSFANKIFAAEDEEQLRAQAQEYYGSNVEITIEASSSDAFKHPWGVGDNRNHAVLFQDPDVLDTWFSSALWPFATLGWPEDTEQFTGSTLSPAGRGQGEGAPASESNLDRRTPSSQPSPLGGEGASRRLTPKPGSDLARHYPNDVLISGFDILFFWDARMAMQGIEFMGEPPWRTLYLHGLVRDAHGQKMSKSKGNTVDPLGLIDKYGADALRFTLAAMESQGRDIKLDEKRVEGYRNFATKLWNAARFLQMNGVGASTSIEAPAAELPVNRWIIGEVVETLAKLDQAFDELRYDEMADAIYHFVWGTFCDWYVELVKGELSPLPQAGGEEARSAEGVGDSSEPPRPHPNPSPEGEGRGADETRRVAAWAFDQILVMLHPLMPFITEELWSANERPYELIVATWPEPQAQIDRHAKAELDWLIGVISAVRGVRTEMSVPPAAMLEVSAFGTSAQQVQWRANNSAAFRRLARVGGFFNLLSADRVESAASFVYEGATYMIHLHGVVDLDAERARLGKGVEAAEKERDSLAQRLSNPNFTERAKPEAVEKARADHEAKSAEAERLRAALERLG
jgi:valyl-tRNA synthetase